MKMKNTQGRNRKGHKNLQAGTPKDFQEKSLQGAITPNTKLSEIVQENEKAAELLFEAGMMCIGCPMAQQETLEQGCRAHGMTKNEINKLVERLNNLTNDDKRYENDFGYKFGTGEKDGPIKKLRKFIKEGK